MSATQPKPKILFCGGSPNQNQQMLQVARALPEFDAWFTPMYGLHPVIKWAVSTGKLDTTILGKGNFHQMAIDFYRRHGLNFDWRGSNNDYVAAVLSSDMMHPQNLQHLPKVWVQEGMTDPYSSWSEVVRRLGLPSWMAFDTSLNGTTNFCDRYCVASQGYLDYFASHGADPAKRVITGMPNYDDCARFLNNDFPHRGYVLVATSDVRECFRRDDRVAWLRSIVPLIDGRQVFFKLHPNEWFERAWNEIQHVFPGAPVYQRANTDHMIANCDVLITQYSTVVYTGQALGKQVHSYFPKDELVRLAPVQNGGTSGQRIADVLRQVMAGRGMALPQRAEMQQVYKLHKLN